MSDGRVYKIETDKGAWLLKEHAPNTSEHQICAEQTIVSALIDNGFTLGIPYVLDDDGKPFAKLADGYWTISRYIDDYPKYDWTKPSWPVETCVNAATGLAQLHLAGYRLLKRSSSIRSEFVPKEINTFTTKFDEAVQQLERTSELAASGLQDFTESTNWLREEVSSTVKQLQEQTLGTTALPTVVHGDYHAGNTLFQGDRLAAIVDLHYVHLGSPLYDLAYATVMFGTNWLRSESLQDGQDSSPALPEFQAAFVMAYRKAVRQLSTEPTWLAAVSDSALLNKYMKLACFLIMHWALEPTPSHQDVQTRNRVYVNALGLLRHLDAP
jgi:Ser/Thr protein kinase RdoA (MazF antagonist)